MIIFQFFFHLELKVQCWPLCPTSTWCFNPPDCNTLLHVGLRRLGLWLYRRTFHTLLLAKWLKSGFRHCRCSLSLRLPLNGCFGQTESRPRGGKQTELSGLWRLGRSGMNKQYVQWETKTPRSLTQRKPGLPVTQMKCWFTAFGVALVDARL